MLIQLGKFRCDFRPWRPETGCRFTGPVAFDTETTMIIDHEIPTYILGAVSDGQKGYFVLPEHVHAFLIAHWYCNFVFHNCAFDLAVLQALLNAQGKNMDVYELVDEHRVWDVLLLHKLHGLCTLGHTHQGKGQSRLERCVQLYLDIDLPKDVKDANGDDVRTSWIKWLGRSAGEIYPIYLEYLARDVLGTFGCFDYLLPRIMQIVENAQGTFGYAGTTWLEEQWTQYGPQTHHLQVMGLIALEEVERAGFGLDLANRADLLAKVQQLYDSLREELRPDGYIEGEKGCDKALQAIIRKVAQQHPELDISRTPTGKYSTTEESLDALAEVSDFFATLKEFRQVRTLLNNYLVKMDASRIHPHYDALKNTGRTGSSGPNIQGFPKKSKKKGKIAFDIRRCFVPATGNLFYVADYASIELRTLAQSLMTQFKLDSEMAKAINAGQDVHRLVAARMKATRLPNASEILATPAQFAAVATSLTDEERSGAKPANFGLPAGMGIKTLKGYARAQYDQPYTDEDAQAWMDAWLASFPEMVHFRKDETDVGLLLAERLQLTPSNYHAVTGEPNYPNPNEEWLPAAWLGWMALKVLKGPAPMKKSGAEYSQAVCDYFWARLQDLAPDLGAKMGKALTLRQTGPALAFAVRRLVNMADVFTITGRLRANASYSARRNTIFQGAASDGAKLALYRLWRAGFKIVAFIHDEVVVEVDADADLVSIKQQIDAILIGAMKELCPDMLIEVEGTFRRRWGKDKADEVKLHESKTEPLTVVVG